MPLIGDGDDFRVFATTQSAEPRYVASVLAATAAAIADPSLAPPSRDNELRDLVFGSLIAKPFPFGGLRTWPDGGYTVIRTATPVSRIVVFDHGSVGYRSIAAHGHADALALWLAIDDEQVFIDAGTYAYHCPAKWRRLMRSTPVHNTLSIGGCSSSEMAGPFNWSRKAAARLIAAKDEPRIRIVGEHDGFLARFGVIHRRTIECGPRNLLIIDELRGAPISEKVGISFLLAPAFYAQHDGNAGVQVKRRTNGADIVNLQVVEGVLQTKILCGDEAGGRGWCSPHFGILQATDQIIFDGAAKQRFAIGIEISSE